MRPATDLSRFTYVKDGEAASTAVTLQAKLDALTDAVAAITAATQAEQEAGASTAAFTSPGRQHFHPSAAKAWVKFTTVTTTAASAAYNCAVTDNGTGDTTITFTTPFSSAEYAIATAASWLTGDGASVALEVSQTNPPTASACRLIFVNAAGTLFDRAGQHAVFYGDQ